MRDPCRRRIRYAMQMESWCARALLRAGCCVSRRTPVSRVNALIELLRPRRTSIPLVRIGPPGDGGYLLPADVSGIRACFSPGVGNESGFELDCACRGMEVHLADASVSGPPALHPGMKFTRKDIAIYDSDRTMTLDSWIDLAGIGADEDLLMQMDIEGSEYAVLSSLSMSRLSQFRYLVVEFHQLHRIWNASCIDLIEGVFRRLLLSHACVHIHPNNSGQVWCAHGIEIPMTMEFTFARRCDTELDGAWGEFPHALDCPNIGGKPDIVLPHCWR